MSARVACGGSDGHNNGHATAVQQPPQAAFAIMQPHTLYLENLPCDLDSDLATQLIQLQLRELSSLDYDLLLRLDDRLQPMTVSANQLAAFLTEVVTEQHQHPAVCCSICKEEYTVGQIRKFLPCNHGFHMECIDRWLSQSSVTCPLDGLSIGLSS